MQTLDVISVNLWDILISFGNLLLLYWLAKRFLFKPVQRVLAKRQEELDAQYANAAQAQTQADENRAMWESRLSGAQDEANSILQNAVETAKNREARILADAHARAEGIVSAARTEAELEMQNAADGVRRSIVEVSGALTEKMLEREINTEDHSRLIDSFLQDMGENND